MSMEYLPYKRIRRLISRFRYKRYDSYGRSHDHMVKGRVGYAKSLENEKIYGGVVDYHFLIMIQCGKSTMSPKWTEIMS